MNLKSIARISCLVGLLAMATPVHAGLLSWLTAPARAMGRLVNYNRWTKYGTIIALSALATVTYKFLQYQRVVRLHAEVVRQEPILRAFAHMQSIIEDEARRFAARQGIEPEEIRFIETVRDAALGAFQVDDQRVGTIPVREWTDMVRNFFATAERDGEINLELLIPIDPAVAAAQEAAQQAEVERRRTLLMQDSSALVSNAECSICCKNSQHLKSLHCNAETLICVECAVKLFDQPCPFCRAQGWLNIDLQ